MSPDKQLPSPRFMALTALACTALFLTFPRLDLIASGWFYAPAHGFVLDNYPLTDFVHNHLGWLAFGSGWLIWLIGRLVNSALETRDWRRKAAYIALVLVLGPGLLVNTVFKDHWGRARPAQIEPFGGQAQFTPAWIPSDQCNANCSFVCGDSSVGFSLLALAFLANHPRRWFIAATVIGGALGLMRMAQGGHFLSDVVFSFFAVYFAAWLLHRVLFPNPGPGNRSDRAI